MYVSCSLKSKNQLYLERGLDILSNKKEVNFILNEDVIIEEVGVIRDKKENTKTLVLKMEPNLKNDVLDGYMVRVRARIKNKVARIEDLDFIPQLQRVKGHSYLTQEIQVPENKIIKTVIYLYKVDDKKRKPVGKRLEIKNLLTNND